MHSELTQEELDRHFYGKQRAPKITFYDHRVVNPVLSHERGERTFETVPYMRKSFPLALNQQVPVDVSRRAREIDQRKFPSEWANYLREKAIETPPTPVQSLEDDWVAEDCKVIA
jgi:hypothetical protein